MELLIEITQIVLPAGLVLYGMYLVVKSFIAREMEYKHLEVRGKSIETVLPNRLHAYERISLFLERISPQNLVTRLNSGEFSALEFQQILLGEIRNEYNHNVSQQIYMSDEVWSLVKTAKEELVMTINTSASEMENNSTSLDLAKKVLGKYMEKEIDPIEHALLYLKNEIRQTY